MQASLFSQWLWSKGLCMPINWDGCFRVSSLLANYCTLLFGLAVITQSTSVVKHSQGKIRADISFSLQTTKYRVEVFNGLPRGCEGPTNYTKISSPPRPSLLGAKGGWIDRAPHSRTARPELCNGATAGSDSRLPNKVASPHEMPGWSCLAPRSAGTNNLLGIASALQPGSAGASSNVS